MFRNRVVVLLQFMERIIIAKERPLFTRSATILTVGTEHKFITDYERGIEICLTNMISTPQWKIRSNSWFPVGNA